jgi:hypothetical protein
MWSTAISGSQSWLLIRGAAQTTREVSAAGALRLNCAHHYVLKTPNRLNQSTTISYDAIRFRGTILGLSGDSKLHDLSCASTFVASAGQSFGHFRPFLPSLHQLESGSLVTSIMQTHFSSIELYEGDTPGQRSGRILGLLSNMKMRFRHCRRLRFPGRRCFASTAYVSFGLYLDRPASLSHTLGCAFDIHTIQLCL